MAEFEKRLACVIRADGTIARGYMIDSCKFDGINQYTISCQIPLQGVAETNFAATVGSASDELVSLPWVRQRSGRDAGSYLRSQWQAGAATVSHRLFSGLSLFRDVSRWPPPLCGGLLLRDS